MKKAFLTILFVTVIIYSCTQLLDNEYVGNFVSVISIISAFIVGTYSHLMADKYNKTGFFLPYMLLAVGFYSYANAEIIWWALERMGSETYPSIADYSYLIFYVGAIGHVVLTIKHFIHVRRSQILVMFALTVLGVSAYSHIVLDEPFVSVTGLFITLNVILVIMAIYAAIHLKKTLLQLPWIVLSTGILLGGLTDITYYIREIYQGYSYSDVENTFWILSDMIILLGLWLHRRQI